MLFKPPLLLISFFLSLFLFDLNAQDLISSAGSNHKDADKSVSWTVGEAVVDTKSNDQVTLTQGFQQPSIQIIALTEEADNAFGIKVYPNPSSAYIILESKKLDLSQVKYEIVDNRSVQVAIGNWITASQNIDISTFTQGTYHLRIFVHNKLANTFKIIKI